MESKPVSGPSCCSRRVLLLRSAPRCSCLVQPFSASSRPKNSIMNEANCALLLRRSGLRRAAPCRRSSAATLSEQKSAKQWFRPWSESRPPMRVEVVVALVRRASRNDWKLRDLDVGGRGEPVHPRVEQAGLVDVERLVRAGRPGNTRVPRPECANRLVLGQVVRRVVGGAKRLHAELLQDALRASAPAWPVSRWPASRCAARWSRRAARRCRSSASVPGGSSGRAGCAACAARCAPRPGTSRRARRRRCSSARPRRWRAWRATCNGRLPARFRTGS